MKSKYSTQNIGSGAIERIAVKRTSILKGSA